MRNKFKPLYASAVLLVAWIMACQPEPQTDTKQEKAATATQSDPLPSWNDGALKQAIIQYVKRVTDSSSMDYIPVADRIATFDNDGTLWAERPYVQELFAFYMVKKILEQHPELAKQQPYKAVVEKDKAYFARGGEKALLQLLVATHTGMSEAEFESGVKSFYTGMAYPLHGTMVPAAKIVYQPQLELLRYLRANGFKTFICTGGTVEFVRGISDAVYGIPKYQVIGSTFKYKFTDSTRHLTREPEISCFNDKGNKPVSIQGHIGQQPVFACGNEGGEGDIAMLKFSQSSVYPSFQMLVNHDDSLREFYYQEKTNASLNAAIQNNWHVISMQKDWKQVFPTN